MKVVILSKSLVVGAYQKKLEELARLPDVDLLAVVPPSWREPLVGEIPLERLFTEGYRIAVLPIVANGQHHFYFFRGLRRLLVREQPDVFHIDEESFNTATFMALRACAPTGARCCFFNWINIDRRYPPPFSWFERYTFRHVAYGIAGNQDAAAILRRHGYGGPLAVLPQFGVDPQLFAPHPTEQLSPPASVSVSPPFVVGYVGRLLERKGVLDLLAAVSGLPPHVRLLLLGDGDLRPLIEERARDLDICQRVEIRPSVRSADVPAVLRQLDALVLPSRTIPGWREQFGRILIEAMSCGVPVVGSSSGEIPNVIGDAGLVFPEGDIAALRHELSRLLDSEAMRRDLARRGRERVLAHYTQAALARSYYEIYCEMASGPKP